MFDQVVDSEVSEKLHAVFSGAIAPDSAMFNLHFIGDFSQPVFIFVKFLGNTFDAGNVTNR
ncbi:hypothetical protein RX330_10650 [Bradyrhizobium sp. NDS-1]|uniref:hypothetical protein n=1 Tax=Bradyrhizobium sp. NDS-1 TaxID=3080014 RepID=UPI00293F08BE|nr:hypothetical protein [Bradyrhizobium sp. NDS-1]WOH75524.1 hypothetical protein RX330_10650 [Bradyrhizobium sp. NDS-1]